MKKFKFVLRQGGFAEIIDLTTKEKMYVTNVTKADLESATSYVKSEAKTKSGVHYASLVLATGELELNEVELF